MAHTIAAATIAAVTLYGMVVGQVTTPTAGPSPDDWSRLATTFGGPGILIGGAIYLLKAFAKFLQEQRDASLANDKQKSELQTAVFNAQISGLNSLAQSQKECVAGLQTASTTQLTVVSQCRELLRESQAHADAGKGIK